MGKLFIIMGKSATGKDTILAELLGRIGGLQEIVEYTTRPKRSKEQDGEDYYFVTEKQLEQLQLAGKVIECRTFDTVHGPWRYFNVDDGQFDLDHSNRIMITTLAGYGELRNYFGAERVIPLYLEISDKTRLHRALEREDRQENPKYAELCRRFLADNEDFSDHCLAQMGIEKRYSNENLEQCLKELTETIISESAGACCCLAD